MALEFTAIQCEDVAEKPDDMQRGLEVPTQPSLRAVFQILEMAHARIADMRARDDPL